MSRLPLDQQLVLKKQITALIESAGEDAFALVVEDIAHERLRTAVGRLMATSWWEGVLQGAVNNPGAYNTQLICKLLDKAVASQQAVKVGADEGFKLIIETEPVRGS